MDIDLGTNACVDRGLYGWLRHESRRLAKREEQHYYSLQLAPSDDDSCLPGHHHGGLVGLLRLPFRQTPEAIVRIFDVIGRSVILGVLRRSFMGFVIYWL